MARIAVFTLRHYDLLARYDIEFDQKLPNLTEAEAPVLMRRIIKKSNLKGRGYILRVDDTQVFYVAQFKEKLTVYRLGVEDGSDLDGDRNVDRNLPGSTF